MNQAEQFAERCHAALEPILIRSGLWQESAEMIEIKKILAGSYSAFAAALFQQKRRGANIPPSLEEVNGYLTEIGYGIEPQAFLDFYEQNGWTVGKAKMKNWQAALRNWKRSNWGQKKGEAPARAQSASLGALQIELERTIEQIVSIVRPGGAAHARTASSVSPEEMQRYNELCAKRDGLRKRIGEFSG